MLFGINGFRSHIVFSFLVCGFSALALGGCTSSSVAVNSSPNSPPVTESEQEDLGEVFSFAEGFRLNLQTADYANATRNGVPISGGIPIARGILSESDLAKLELAHANGQRVKSFQKPHVLARWNDGSVKWLLLDFLGYLEAEETDSYTLGLVDEPFADDPAIEVTESDDAYLVDTKAIKVKLSKNQFGLFDQVWVDANLDGTYGSEEEVVSRPGEMFIDLLQIDASNPAPENDPGAYNYPDTWYFGMEGGNWLKSAPGHPTQRYLASAGDYSITLFREGETHTIFKVEGWHRHPTTDRQFGKYTLYLHFYLRQRMVRASHTWIMTGDPNKNFIRRMALTVPFQTDGSQIEYSFGGEFETEGTPVVLNPSEPPLTPLNPGPSHLIEGRIAPSEKASLTSIGPDKYYHNVPMDWDTSVEYTVRQNGNTVSSGKSPSGFALFADGTHGVSVGIRDFWREHPKEVQYDNQTVSVYLWPDEGDRFLDLRRRYPEVRGTVSEGWGDAARREFNQPGSAVGLAKTTDVFFSFQPKSQTAAETDHLFRGFQEQLRPFVSPEHNVETGIFGPMPAYDADRFNTTENFIDLAYAWIFHGQKEFGWHGMMDFGDTLIEYESINWELNVPPNYGLYQNWGYSGWGQEAYRIGFWLFVRYLRTGNPKYLQWGDSWLRHHRDVDCVFHDAPDDGPRPTDNDSSSRVGGGHRHDQQHWGAYMAGYGVPTLATALHYFITGDGRDLDAMEDFSQWALAGGNETYSEYAVLYMQEALGDSDLIERALAKGQEPGVGFGRLTHESGMGLLLHDVQTNGSAQIRSLLRNWIDVDVGDDNRPAAFIRGYLASVEGDATLQSRVRNDFETIFANTSVRTSYFSNWAPRLPEDLYDALGTDFMPQGPFEWPLRMVEHLIYDAPHGMMNNPTRQHFIATLPWLMDVYGSDPE